MKIFSLLISVVAIAMTADAQNRPATPIETVTPLLDRMERGALAADLIVRSLDAWSSTQLAHYYPFVRETTAPGGEFMPDRPALEWAYNMSFPAVEWLVIRSLNRHDHRRLARMVWWTDCAVDGKAAFGNLDLLNKVKGKFPETR